jgi:hypothetical protein
MYEPNNIKIHKARIIGLNRKLDVSTIIVGVLSHKLAGKKFNLIFFSVLGMESRASGKQRSTSLLSYIPSPDLACIN